MTYGPDASLRLRVAVDVDAGAELCHSYTDLCTPTHMRRQGLAQRYGFECTCVRCCSGASYRGEDVDALMEALQRAGQGAGQGAGKAHAKGPRRGGSDDDDGDSGAVLLGEDGGDGIDRLIGQSESALIRAEQCGSAEEACHLTKQALMLRRRLCHPLSLLRYHAESAMCALALQFGDAAKARECGRHAIAFLEMALAHVPWHPSLSIDRMHLACSEAAAGDKREAARQMDLCVPALKLTHGEGHALTQRAEAVRRALRRHA